MGRPRPSSVASPAPALVPALGAITGTAFGLEAAVVAPGLVVALLVLAVALARGAAPGSSARSKLAPFLVAVALAALGTTVGERPGREAWTLDPGRPVEVVGTVTGPWRGGPGSGGQGHGPVGRAAGRPDGAAARFRIATLAQRPRLRLEPLEVWLHLPAPAEDGSEVLPPMGSQLRVKGFLRRSAPLRNRPDGRLDLDRPGPWRLRVGSHRLVEVEAAPGVVGRWSTRLRERLEDACRRAELQAEHRAEQDRAEQDRAEQHRAEQHRAERHRAEHPRDGSRIDTAAAPDHAGRARHGVAFVRALVLGRSEAVDPTVARGLRRLGLGHLLAVSGLHVGLLLALVLGPARLLGAGLGSSARTGLRLVLGVVALGLYLLLAGPRASLLRAATMAVLVLGASALGRPPAGRNGLAVAVIALLATDPGLVEDLGWRLTVGATAGILFLGLPAAEALASPSPNASAGHATTPDGARLPGRGPLHDLLHRHLYSPLHGLLQGLLRAFAVTVGAQVGTLPFALPAFATVCPWAPLFNLVAVPWTAALLALGLLWSGLALVAPDHAATLMPVLDAVAAPLAWPAAWAPRPWISLPVAPEPAVAWLVTGLVALGLWAVGRWGAGIGQAIRRGRAIVAVLALALALALVLALVLAAVIAVGAWGVADPAPTEDSDHPVEVVFLDVGQGDAVLVRDGDRAMLVDGGGWPSGDLGGRVLVPALVRRGLRRLDAVVLTHPDLDHCGGLRDLVGHLEVGAVVTGPRAREDPPPCLAGLLAAPGPVHRRVAAGARLAVGRWRLEVLHPSVRASAGIRSATDNDASVVLRATIRGRRVLLTGDLERRGEEELVERLAAGDLGADVLKVAHHGSRSSSHGPFLDAVGARLAVVSSGRSNPYGHPAPETLGRLRRHGAAVLRTDRSGAVAVRVEPDGRLRIGLSGGG